LCPDRRACRADWFFVQHLLRQPAPPRPSGSRRHLPLCTRQRDVCLLGSSAQGSSSGRLAWSIRSQHCCGVSDVYRVQHPAAKGRSKCWFARSCQPPDQPVQTGGRAETPGSGRMRMKSRPEEEQDFRPQPWEERTWRERSVLARRPGQRSDERLAPAHSPAVGLLRPHAAAIDKQTAGRTSNGCTHPHQRYARCC